jgi:hypothetical protein
MLVVRLAVVTAKNARLARGVIVVAVVAQRMRKAKNAVAALRIHAKRRQKNRLILTPERASFFCCLIQPLLKQFVQMRE